MSVSPSRPRGPSLNALRAFETAARLGSFALAAEELSVTPGAISQHIKTVEGWAGVALFARAAHSVHLTDAGRDIAGALEGAFDQIHQTMRGIQDLNPRPRLAIAALPSVAQLWLQPRLPAIRGLIPDVNLSLHALESPPDLRRNLYDLSLFITEPRGRSTETVLETDIIFPVCAPAVAGRIRSIADLASVTLIVDETWQDDWTIWARHAGVPAPDLAEAARHSLYSMALSEAIAGTGMLIGHRCLVGPHLHDGSLVRPFPQEAETGKALVLTVPEMGRLPASLQAVRDGLAGTASRRVTGGSLRRLHFSKAP